MKQLLFLSFLITTKLSCAQDASLLKPLLNQHEQSSARSMGLAGAFGAVGADFSNATHNPAGIAFFRKKELGLGISSDQKTLNSEFLNTNKETNQQKLRLNNFGYVFSNLMTKREMDSLKVYKYGLVGTAVTIGINNKANFNEEVSYSGYNTESSLLSSYAEYANNFARNSPDNLSEFERQAVQTDLLKIDEQNGTYSYSSEIENGEVNQAGRRIRKGSVYDLYFGVGTNFTNKLYLGASVGVPIYTFNEQFVYSEKDSQNKHQTFDRLALAEDKKFSGLGSYLRVGGIYRVSDYLRAGLHIKTPSAILITESSSIGTSNGDKSTSKTYSSEYRLTTPFQTGLQIVASHPSYGLISLEGDYKLNSGSKIRYEEELGDLSANEAQYKEDIKRTHKSSLNGRIGLEARLAKQFRLRGGFAYYGSPYKQKELQYGAKASKQVLGLGIGYRDVATNLMFDLGYNYNSTGEFESAYLYRNQPNPVKTDKETHQIKIGISKRFNQ